jgi:hypothetical protein
MHGDWELYDDIYDLGEDGPYLMLIFYVQSISFFVGFFSVLIMLVEILSLFLEFLRPYSNGILIGFLLIFISIPWLGVSLDLGIAAGSIGLIVGSANIILHFVFSDDVKIANK